MAIEIASELQIPVMFNAMNIQKYDAKDWRCQFLREHANRACVKMITSRDGSYGVERLIKDWRMEKNLSCNAVGDVAFWIPECYQIGKRKGKDAVGINLIDGNIFRRYGNSLAEDELLQIYLDLLNELDRKGIQWELFTNGLSRDNEFGIKLLKKYGDRNIKIRIPDSKTALINIITDYRAVLGARLHACICAYALDVPFVGFIWDEKLYHFSKMAEIENCFVKEADLSGRLLFEKLTGEDIILNSGQIELRALWKSKTQKYIADFLQKYV